MQVTVKVYKYIMAKYPRNLHISHLNERHIFYFVQPVLGQQTVPYVVQGAMSAEHVLLTDICTTIT